MILLVLLGILQGATEFLPVSSSGHLYLAQYLSGIEPDIDLAIFLHFASLLAVVLYFFPKISELILDFFLEGGRSGESRSFSLKLLLATLITIPIAVVIEPYFDQFISLKTVGITLLITGAMIFIAEFIPKKSRKFSWIEAIVLGVVQGLTVIPGISRSGTTIAALLSMGIERKKATEISFLLAIPTILGATIFTFNDIGNWQKIISPEFLWAGVASFITSFLAIMWMMRWAQKQWIFFGVYCVGGGLWIVFL